MENEVNEVVEVANDTTDYKSLYEEKNAKVSELEGLIQKHKKAPKAETTEAPKGEVDFERMLDEREFYKTNPGMAEYKDQIKDFTSTGKVSLEQAKKLVIDANPDIVARQNTQKSNFTAGTPDFGKSEYNITDLESMTQSQYNQVIKLQQEGKVVIK